MVRVRTDPGLEPAQHQVAWRFDDFELRPGRELRRDGAPIALGKTALDLLGALVRARGALVTKDELFDAAWPDVVVVENALHQHVRALRNALGDRSDLIGTVARRGYRFLGAVEEIAVEVVDAPLGEAPVIPSPLTPLIGRENDLTAAEALLQSHRCLSLLGPGGVGKTRLALEMAQRQRRRGAGRVHWADLAGIGEGEGVAAALAASLGLTGPSSLAPLARMRHALRDAKSLLVLDNCEHLIEACAAAALELLTYCPGLRLLATSQRPLGIAGEQRFALALLGLPPPGVSDASTIAAAPAVQLLLARVAECGPQSQIDTAGLMDAAELCRQLDGNALAIELAAPRVAALGLPATRLALGDHFQLLAGGRRDAMRRHQSLSAMIDWSHDLLPAAQRAVWRRLSVFAGGWTIESATAVVGPAAGKGTIDADGSTDIASSLADLVERSLVSCDASGPVPRFRMLEAQRLHAIDKLCACGEQEPYSAAHARHLLALFEASYAQWDLMPDALWLRRYGPERDNLRAAIRFALESTKPTLAARLVGASIWLWRAIGAIHEMQQLLQHPLLQSSAALPGQAQARLLLAQAYGLHATSSESLRVKLAAEQAVAVFEGSPDPLGAINAQLCLASAYAQLGDTAAHRACLDRVDGLVGAATHGKAYGWYCGSHAWAAQLAGDLPSALDWAVRSRAAYRGSGAWLGQTRAMLHMADLCLALGDVDEALAIGQASVTRLEGQQHRADHGRALANLGAAWLARGNLESARDCWTRALDALRGLDFSYWVFDHIALLAIAQRRDACAAQLIGYADAGYARLRKGRRVQNEQRAHAQAMAHLASHFGSRELASLLAVGALAAEDEVIAIALAQP